MSSGRIITFYSYKGGTGRSMAVANTAWVLASNGKRVLVIDWDLEAPGIHRYLHPFLRDDPATTDGLMDFILDFTTAALSPASSSDATEDAGWYLPYANLLSCATSLDWEFQEPGTLDFVSAGRQDAGYPVRVNSYDWRNFYEKLGGGVFLEEVKRRLREEYDYILIDSRTGLSDTSGICTVQMPDDLVVCFTLNRQSVEGASAAASSALAQRIMPGTEEYGLRVLPLITRVDSSEKVKLDAALAAAAEHFNPLLLAWLDEDLMAEYWAGTQMPYVPFYAYEETLATFADTPLQGGTVLSSVESLTSWITGEAIRLVPCTEPRRLEILQRFLRKPGAPAVAEPRYLFFLSYARQDFDDNLSRFFTDLVTQVSTLTGLDADEVGWLDYMRLRPGDHFGEENSKILESCRSVVALISPTYVRSNYCLQELDEARSAGKAAIPISWIPAEIPPQIRELSHFHFPAGVRSIIRDKRLEDQYQQAVFQCASAIAKLAPAVRSSTAASPPEILSIIVAERRSGDIRILRNNTRSYGSRRRDWYPFWSQKGPSCGEAIRAAAARCGVQTRLTSLSTAHDWLRKSNKPSNARAVVVVDPWSLQIAEQKEFARNLARHLEVDARVILCFDHDGETNHRREELEKSARLLFRHPVQIADCPQELDAFLESALTPDPSPAAGQR